MILKALYDRYCRLQNVGKPLAPVGFQEKKISFVVVISSDGQFMRVEDRRIGKKDAQKFFVLAQSRSSGIKAYTFYDNIEYCFGYSTKNPPEKALPKHQAFITRCSELADKYPECADFKSVADFYAANEHLKVVEDPLWEDMCKNEAANISFLVQGQTEIVATNPVLAGEVESDSDADENLYPCLITGKLATPVLLTTATPIPGAKSNAKIVAFQINSGYDSYGKSQCLNAPISKEAESFFSSALNKLINNQSPNRFLIGNRTYVFWASSDNEEARMVEMGFASICGIGPVDDPDSNIKAVKDLFKSIYSGKSALYDEDKFYIMGLAPNAARIAIVYWQELSLREFAGNILRHFDDMSIIDGRKEKKPYRGLREMMSAVTLGGKQSEVQPNLPDATAKAIFGATPYPTTLYLSALRRIRAELDKGMLISRVAIIKGYLNRCKTNNEQPITYMIDTTNRNVGYLCGRLFALIELAQKRALGINTVKERYMNSASATPVAVFPTLLNLSNHHIEKLNSPVFFEKLKSEIIGNLPASGFPTHLSLLDQGRFFIGYYHQMQDFYKGKQLDAATTSSEDVTETGSDEIENQKSHKHINESTQNNIQTTLWQ